MRLAGHKRDLGNCTYCPKLCRFCCPTAEVEHSETVTPWAKMSIAEMVRAGRLEAVHEIGEVFYHCFGCLHCRTHCGHGNDVPGTLVEARGAVLAAGGEPSAVSSVIGKFQDTGNPWGEDLLSMLKKRVEKKYFVPEAQAVLFAGCQAIRQESEWLGKIFELLGALGVDYLGAYEGEDLCCGMPLWQAGDRESFGEHAAKVRDALSKYRTVVCPCPTCAYAFQSLYAGMDLALSAKVVHLAEFVAPLIEGREPSRRVEGTHTFHDPCYLGRYLECTDLPRRILSGVLQEPLAESNWSGEDAACCGGGGLVPHVLPEVASGAAGLRMDQLKLTGAKKVITACPGCVRQLSSAPKALEVVDFCEVLHAAYCD